MKDGYLQQHLSRWVLWMFFSTHDLLHAKKAATTRLFGLHESVVVDNANHPGLDELDPLTRIINARISGIQI
ncbi:hypothetical protein PAEVO_14610 [Paenibacillus sp. GM2FR]|nr:hypothetical protein PAEVO_14610 [Paenibacillus sp. GM2FR]